MASITVNTNGQVLRVNASISHWTSAALAVVASGDDDIPSTDTTTITSDYTMHFANTATTVTVTVKQLDGTTISTGTYDVNPGIGPRTLNPAPDAYKLAEDTGQARQFALAPSGAIAETIPRSSGATLANNSLVLSGRMNMTAVYLPKGAVVSTATFVSATTALDTGSNQWCALYTSSRVLLGQTVDRTNSAWAANTAKVFTWATPITTTYAGLHYIGIVVVASTVPTFFSSNVNGNVTVIAPAINGYADASLTDTAPPTATTLSASTTIPYAYLA